MEASLPDLVAIATEQIPVLVVASGPTLESIELARTFLKENQQGIDMTFQNPIESGISGVSWLSKLIKKILDFACVLMYINIVIRERLFNGCDCNFQSRTNWGLLYAHPL